jgi:DNA-binding NtrC family response regulator
MQITIVGEFNSDGMENTVATTDEGAQTKLTFLKDARQAIEEFDAGLVSDLVVCGQEIDIRAFTANFEALGIPVPAMLQPAKLEKMGDDAKGLPSKKTPWDDPSSWLGNENNPLRLGQRLADMERELILQTLTHCGGNRTYAADILGISSRTMRNKLQQYSAEGRTITASRFRQSSHADINRPHNLLPS